jgi:hypothetical protein
VNSQNSCYKNYSWFEGRLNKKKNQPNIDMMGESVSVHLIPTEINLMGTLGIDATVISFSNSKLPEVTKLQIAHTKITLGSANAQLHVVFINSVKAGSLKSLWTPFSLNQGYLNHCSVLVCFLQQHDIFIS